MIENGFNYAVSKQLEKEARKLARKESTKKYKKAMDTIHNLQEKYCFTFGLMDKVDAAKMTEKERKQYYNAIKYTTPYDDKFLQYLGLC